MLWMMVLAFSLPIVPCPVALLVLWQMGQISRENNVDFFLGDYSGERAKIQFPKALALKRVIVGSSGAVSNNDPTNPYAFSVDIRQGTAAARALALYAQLITSGKYKVDGPVNLAIIHRASADVCVALRCIERRSCCCVLYLHGAPTAKQHRCLEQCVWAYGAIATNACLWLRIGVL
jgi:hypothetical protein